MWSLRAADELDRMTYNWLKSWSCMQTPFVWEPTAGVTFDQIRRCETPTVTAR